MAFKGNIQQDSRKWKLEKFLVHLHVGSTSLFLSEARSFQVGLLNSQEQQLTTQKKQKLSDALQQHEP